MTLDTTTPVSLNEYLHQLQQRYDTDEQRTRMSLDDYMQLLQNRADEFMAPRLARHSALPAYPPLLEWFILATDAPFVEPPTPAPKRTPTPRQDRSSDELRAQRDTLDTRRTAIMFDGDDPAACNIGTPARWEKLDRDIATVAKLTRRIDRLDAQILAAEHREKRQQNN
jgi:hypothetical protein